MDVYRWVMAIEIVFSNRHKLQRYCVDRLVTLGQQGIPGNRAIANQSLTTWILEADLVLHEQSERNKAKLLSES